jgi:hypothetical protein
MSTIHDDAEPAFLPHERWWMAAGAIALSAFLLFLAAIANLDVVTFLRPPLPAVAAEALGASAGLHWFAILVIWLGLASAQSRAQRQVLQTMMAVALLGLAIGLGAGLASISQSVGSIPDAPR